MNEAVNTNHDDVFEGMDTLQLRTAAIFQIQKNKIFCSWSTIYKQ